MIDGQFILKTECIGLNLAKILNRSMLLLMCSEITSYRALLIDSHLATNLICYTVTPHHSYFFVLLSLVLFSFCHMDQFKAAALEEHSYNYMQ